jgi:hypothetical protein
MTGEFTLASFGPTEFKAILIVYGLVLSAIVILGGGGTGLDASVPLARRIAYWFYVIMLVVGVAQLVMNLVLAVRDVNRQGHAADTTEWEVARVRSVATPTTHQHSTSREDAKGQQNHG